MADRYWVGGTGTWNTGTTNWSTTSGGSSGASAPTSADNVIFDQAATYTVTMTLSLSCLNITVSAGTVTFSGNSSTIDIYGSMSLVAETVWPSTGTLFFKATTTGKTITTNGISMKCGVIFNGIGGGWSLGSTVIFDNTTNGYGITLTTGALDLNGYDLTCGEFKSNNSNVRSIAFGINYIIICGLTSSNYGLTMNTITNFSCTGSGGFYVIELTSLIARYYACGNTAGGSSANAPNLTFSTGSGSNTQDCITGSWFNILDFGTSSYTITALGATSLNLNGLTLSSSGTYTSLTATMRGTGNIISNGKTIAALTINNGVGTTTLSDAALCTTFTMTAGTIDFGGLDLTCSSTATYTSGTLVSIGTITCTTFTINGPAFDFTSGTINPSTSFVLTSGSFTYGNGGTLGAVPTFTHTAGTVTFNASYALTVTGTYTLTAGSLILSYDATLSTGIFSSTGTGTRSIQFGYIDYPGWIFLTHTTPGTTVLSMATLTNFTYTGPYGFYVNAMSNTRTFTCGTTGGTTSNAPNLTFNTGASVATITTGSYFNTLDFGTTSFNPVTTSLNLNNLTLSGSGTYNSLSATTRGTGTITSNGITMGVLTINNGAGTTTLSAALSCSTFTQTAGTMDFGGFNLTCSSTATYTSGTLVSIGTLACTTFTINGPAFDFTSGTINPSTSFVLTSGSFTYNGGTLVAVPTFTHTAGTVTFNTSYALTTTGTYSHNSGALILADGVTLSTGIYSATSNSSIQFGTASAGNINLTHTTAATIVVSITSVTNSSFSGPGGFTCTDMSVARQFLCGSTSGPTSATLPNLTFSTGSAAITITATSYFNNIDFGTVSSTVSGGVGVIGNATLSSSATYTGLVMTFLLPAASSQTLTTNGKTINALTVQPTTVSPSYTGKVTFAGAVTMTNAFTFSGGTIVAPYNISCLNFAMPNASLGSPYTRIFRGSNTNLTLTGNSVSSVSVFSNTPATGLTMTNINIRMTSSAIKTFAGGNATYPVLINAGAGNLTISGNNTFDTITNSVQPTTFRFTANTTQTVTNFNVAGISGSLVTINSTSSPNPATLSKSSGFVNGGFLSIQDSTVTGGATWYAGPTSTNTSNNTGWIFTRLPVVTITNLSMSNITISDDPIPS